MNFFNQIENKIIDILNEQNIDRISMAGIIGTLRQENLNENSFLNFIEGKSSLTIEDCTRPNMAYARMLKINTKKAHKHYVF